MHFFSFRKKRWGCQGPIAINWSNHLGAWNRNENWSNSIFQFLNRRISNRLGSFKCGPIHRQLNEKKLNFSQSRLKSQRKSKNALVLKVNLFTSNQAPPPHTNHTNTLSRRTQTCSNPNTATATHPHRAPQKLWLWHGVFLFIIRTVQR